MMPYYWTPTTQQQMTPPPPAANPSTLPVREQSYIENILRLNRGKPGTFHFSFEHAIEQGQNTKIVRGVVEAAGRDHVILRELKSNHRFLFPMIYFDYAEYDEEMAYFNQNP
ncbi:MULTISPECIES: spore coat protein GerQ [unclassified Lysinibacillus]|uniref:spore coat protein GerQ n=1 Tax=unclassified Lysinibacillus TaxID=2636778 RepID=UPI0025562AF4|nr:MULTISPECIES: spore coat protein GerQ [unclassified Lysinibacillus]MDM5246310.1 spore coat protein GerQ [Lysinibacillus sp. G4S2]